MVNEKMYSATDVCAELNISRFTLTHWYDLQSNLLRDGMITEKYLPEPVRLTNERGKPRRWTQEMVDALRKYQENIVVGRNGIYGMYTNPNHLSTRKYQKHVDKA